MHQKNPACQTKFCSNPFKLNSTAWTWKNLLLWDESTCNLRETDRRSYVRRLPGDEFSPKYTTVTVRGTGGGKYDEIEVGEKSEIRNDHNAQESVEYSTAMKHLSTG